MTIAIVQYSVQSAPADAVVRGLDALKRAAASGARLVVFPELSFTTFYPQYPADKEVADLAEPIDGPTVSAFQRAARDLGVVVVINIFERAGDHTYDSSPVIDADGSLLGVTRMVHITDYDCFHEKGYYHPGDMLAPVYQTAVGALGVAICYDRHYPEYMRSLALGGADLVVIPQAGVTGEWPDGMYENEIRVASFQNGYFCAMANRVGKEGRLDFCGGSVITDPWGKIVAQAAFGEEEILVSDLELGLCDMSPARKLFLRDRRPEVYEEGALRLARPPGSPG
jgi:N-carbamoylputrescine amidase